jgi:hypothetical protein
MFEIVFLWAPERQSVHQPIPVSPFVENVFSHLWKLHLRFPFLNFVGLKVDFPLLDYEL